MSATTSSRDPFPRDRFTALLRRLPGYARLAWHLARDERLSRSRRAALLAGAAYLVSPIDLVPGIIPVAGQLDDAVVVLLAIRLALAGLPVADREAALAEAGLDSTAIDDDVRTIGADIRVDRAAGRADHVAHRANRWARGAHESAGA